MSQVHTEFLALSHFTHYLISSTQKPDEVDNIHSILPVRSLKLEGHTSSKWQAIVHTLAGLFRVHWGGREMAEQE